MESLTETTPRSLHLSALPLSFPSLHLPFRVCCKQAWAAGFLWFHLFLVQPTLAQLRKAGMSRTGTLRVKALTRRLRSSVRRTTSLWSLTVPSVYGAEVVKSICRYVKHQRGLHTFLIRHEVFSLVFAVVETAGQNHIVVISLGKKKKEQNRKLTCVPGNISRLMTLIFCHIFVFSPVVQRYLRYGRLWTPAGFLCWSALGGTALWLQIVSLGSPLPGGPSPARPGNEPRCQCYARVDPVHQSCPDP